MGGYAVAVHGYPRYTKDLDIWIDRTPENAARLVNALVDFGLPRLRIAPIFNRILLSSIFYQNSQDILR